jgi:hypothetical protein
MAEIKDLISIGVLVFGAGGLWQIVKTLKENLVELKGHGVKLQEIVSSHETRLIVLESHKAKRRK